MFSFNPQDLPVERNYRALWDRKEIGHTSEINPRLAARRIEKIYGDRARFDIDSPRFEIEEV